MCGNWQRGVKQFRSPKCYLVMCNTYRNIHSISWYNIGFWVYWYTGVGSLVNLIFPICLMFIPKTNYNKLVCITLIDFFYHFLINTSKQDIYFHFISISIIISNIGYCIVSWYFCQQYAILLFGCITASLLLPHINDT